MMRMSYMVVAYAKALLLYKILVDRRPGQLILYGVVVLIIPGVVF